MITALLMFRQDQDPSIQKVRIPVTTDFSYLLVAVRQSTPRLPYTKMSSSTLTNVILLAPNGSIAIHDDGHVLCIHGPEWRTALYITTFFATNYLAHAATVKASPGDRTLVGIYHIISALLLPMYGLIRAANAIARRHKWRGSSLENACRAGALCMVVRVPGWMPAENQCFDAFLSNLNEETDK